VKTRQSSHCEANLTEDSRSSESGSGDVCWLKGFHEELHEESLLASVVNRRWMLARTSFEGRWKDDMKLDWLGERDE